ncbi:MAG: response regulator transcription factor [Myxococcales bacterium]|nr:response regulator transcription factor [Myxococcales bacterium]
MTRRVVIVDDDPGSRQTAEAMLLPLGLELRILAGGAALLDELASPPADVVVCDVMMPAVDGFAVCRAVRAHPQWRYVPVILLTALGDRDAIVAGLEAGADEFVTKPAEGAVLRARVQAMLRVRDRYLALAAATPPPSDRLAELVATSGLTAREREVLDLLVLGRSHGDIAQVLGISERTSKFHQGNLLAKLGAESRLDLMRLLR